MNYQLENIAESQKKFFFTGKTKPVSHRIKNLSLLKQAIVHHEADLIDALYKDLGKPVTEAYTSDIAPVLHEIDVAVKKIKSWSTPKKVGTPFMLFPASSYIYPEPYGTALIIGTWNYPVQLTLAPLAAAISAGNCAVVKPSELAVHTSRVMAKLINNTFESDYITVVEGAVPETQTLLEQDFDYIFFTGGTEVGKIVMSAAAKHLTPVTLELGGKNPCIVDKDADLDKAADRICWGKFFNAGQTCIAPDYIMVHRSIKKLLLDKMKSTLERFYTKDPSSTPDFGRVINERHFTRLSSFLNYGNIVIGGKTISEQRYIAPTIIEEVSWDNPIMQDEIFGPLLPILEFDDLDQLIHDLKPRPKPLALYYFSSDKSRQEKVLAHLSSGGATINDTFAHLLNQRLPFGGVGASGMGAYHSKAGFDTFSHFKSVVKRSVWADPKSKYPPYSTPLKYLKKVIKYMS